MQNSAPVTPKKSNLWLIVIVIVVLLALLWPVLRRGKTPTDLTSTLEEMATTSEIIDLENVSLDSSPAPSSDVSVAPVIPGSVSVPISAPAPAFLALKVFFGNQVRNPQTWQCRTAYPIIRTVPNTSAVARAALAELLKGPNEGDSSAGFFTSINPGVAIKQLTINNGAARVDFSQVLISEAGTSTPCLKEGARAQITETLKQFPTVRSVIISVNGILF